MKILEANTIEATEETEISRVIQNLELAQHWHSIENEDLKSSVKNIIWSTAHLVNARWGQDNEEHLKAKKIYLAWKRN